MGRNRINHKHLEEMHFYMKLAKGVNDNVRPEKHSNKAMRFI